MKVTVEQIVEAVRETGEKGILVHELAEKLNVSTACINNRVPKIISTTPNLIRRERECTNVMGHSYRYFGVEQETQEEAPEENTNKNAEGYSDPTACQAINNADNQNKLIPGYIYKRGLSTGSLFLVLDIEEDSVIGYNVEENSYHTDGVHLVEWDVDGTYYVVRYHRVASANPRSLYKFVDQCPNDALSTIVSYTPIQIGRLKFNRRYKLYTENEVKIRLIEACRTLNDKHSKDLEELRQTCVADRDRIMSEKANEINSLKEELDEAHVVIENLRDALSKSESKAEEDGADHLLDLQRADIYEKVYKDLIMVLTTK